MLSPQSDGRFGTPTLYVLDSQRSLVPPRIAGELYIGGAGVARGYLGRPELTTERFILNPYGEGRLYRTGDRVRWGADRELEFQGRIDHQFKIHGIRIEPGEIEASLLALPGIAAAVVTLHEDSAGVPHLVAYLVNSPDAEPAIDRCARGFGTAIAAQHGADAIRLARRDAINAQWKA